MGKIIVGCGATARDLLGLRSGLGGVRLDFGSSAGGAVVQGAVVLMEVVVGGDLSSGDGLGLAITGVGVPGVVNVENGMLEVTVIAVVASVEVEVGVEGMLLERMETDDG